MKKREYFDANGNALGNDLGAIHNTNVVYYSPERWWESAASWCVAFALWLKQEIHEPEFRFGVVLGVVLAMLLAGIAFGLAALAVLVQ